MQRSRSTTAKQLKFNQRNQPVIVNVFRIHQFTQRTNKLDSSQLFINPSFPFRVLSTYYAVMSVTGRVLETSNIYFRKN